LLPTGLIVHLVRKEGVIKERTTEQSRSEAMHWISELWLVLMELILFLRNN